MPDNLPHLALPGPASIPWRYPGVVIEKRPLPERDPQTHATRLLADLESVRAGVRELDDQVVRVPGAEGHLLTARIQPDTPANIAGLGDRNAGSQVVALTSEGALIHMRRDNLGYLERKIADYANPHKLTRKGARKNAPLVAPLEELRLATLADLSGGWLSEDDLESETTYWVELWAAGGNLGSMQRRRETREQIGWLVQNDNADAPGALRAFVAAEHDIYLVQLHADALRLLPAKAPDIYRVGPPLRVQVPWLVADQHTRTLPECAPPADDETVVVLLDTGVAEQHPLLAPAVHSPGQSVIVGNPSAEDTYGHGTRMAGLVAHEDLAVALASGQTVVPRSRIQSIRVMEGPATPDLEFWPERTVEAIDVAEATLTARRVFSMPLGAAVDPPGERTAWGVAVDSLAYRDGSGRLICVPTGNILPSQGQPPAYPATNLAGGMTTPGEAVNAVTVGALTELVVASPERVPVAQAGQLSPYSRADVGGNRPIKPDVVFEGGNWATDGSGAFAEPSLSLLTTARGHAIGPPLTTTNATSAACSQAAGLLSEIWQKNPNRRPETIRGLLVHAARWTAAMRAQFPDERDLRRASGYGRPEPQHAKYSNSRRATMILESELQPELPLNAGREMHFVHLPLPEPALESLGDTVIEISVTLSFFSEPNENNLRRYQGAGLRWGLQRPLETEAQFRERINKLERTEDYAGAVEDLPWEIGQQARSRGTVQSDRAQVTAEELRGGRAVAVWPVGGWWRGRPDRERTPVRYSLIVSLDAGGADIDIYTSIENELSIQTIVGT